MLAVTVSISMITMYPFSRSMAQVSVYHPFPDSNAVWGMSSTCNFDMVCGTNAYIRDYYDGDTLIEGLVYKIISEQYLIIDGSANCCDPDYGGGACFLREDTASRLVLIRFPGMMDELILYDFNMNTGDTVTGYYSDLAFCGFENAVVQSVDSILIDGMFRKRLNIGFVDGVTDFSFIEGIGSTNGLKTCYLYASGEIGIELDCVTVNGDPIYVSPNAPDSLSCAEFPISMSELDAISAESVATPNPSTGLFHLSDAAERITVYNAMGKLLFRGQGNTIDLSAWPPGVYTAVLRTAKGIRTQRLVVVR